MRQSSLATKKYKRQTLHICHQQLSLVNKGECWNLTSDHWLTTHCWPMHTVFTPNMNIFAPNMTVFGPNTSEFAPNTSVFAQKTTVFAPKNHCICPKCHCMCPKYHCTCPKYHCICLKYWWDTDLWPWKTKHLTIKNIIFSNQHWHLNCDSDSDRVGVSDSVS